MVRVSKTLCPWLVACLLAACHRGPPAAAPSPAAAVAPADTLAQLLAAYEHEHIAQEDVIGAQQLADARALERRYLDALGAVPRDALDEPNRHRYDLFRRQREFVIEGFTYPEELVPLKSFGSPPFRLAAAALASGQRTLGAADYAAWARELDLLCSWLTQARANLREGLARGYTIPRPLVERLLVPLAALGRDAPDNPFYTPLRSMAGTVSAADRERLTRAYNESVAQRLLPALRDLQAFLAKDYVPKARTTLSLADLPLGAAWYAYRLKRATGGEALPADLNKQGLAAVERLKARSPAGEPPAPRAAADLLGAYQQLADSVAPKLGALFAADAPAPLAIAAVDLPLEAVSAVTFQPDALFVQAPGAGGRFSVADFLAAALPGEAWRQALQAPDAGPRAGHAPQALAYVQGWDMYAASLGEELGLYSDEAARSSWAARQLRCAAGLVVDTGVHALGWTRDKALDYLHAQAQMETGDAGALLDAIVSSPGDTAACELGAAKFQQLRGRAQQVLGARFDVKEFHQQLLGAGPASLDELDARIKAWLEASR